VPVLTEVLALDDAAVLASFLSGAGPSVAVLAVRNLERVSQLLQSMYERAGVAATVRVLGVHLPSEALAGAAASGHGRTV